MTVGRYRDIMRRSVLFAFVVPVAVLSFVAGRFCEVIERFHCPEVPLTAGLHGRWSTLNEIFDRRVRAAFPLGSSREAMTSELVKQGFRRADWSSSIADEHQAVRHEDNLVCFVSARVFWREDDSGRPSEVRGVYGEEGCF